MTPTESDMGRDLAADLEVCEKATPGPWECRHPLGDDRLPAPSPSMVGPGAKSFGGPFPVAHCYGMNFADGDFIAEAREGWPAAIRRALAAEAARNDAAEALSMAQTYAGGLHAALIRIARTEFIAPEDYDDREAYSWAQDQIHGVIRMAREAMGGGE